MGAGQPGPAGCLRPLPPLVALAEPDARAIVQVLESGDPGKTRTSDTQFRKLLLYPPELRGHV